MNKLKELLLEDERILWHGTPNKRSLIFSEVLYSLKPVLYMIIFAGIVIFLIRNEPIANPEDIDIVITAGIVMLGIALSFCLVSAIKGIKAKKDVVFAITDKRVIVCNVDYESIPHSDIFKIRTPRILGGVIHKGTITITDYNLSTIKLFCIDNYQEVYDKINERVKLAKENQFFDNTKSLQNIKRIKWGSLITGAIPVVIIIAFLVNNMVFIPIENDKKEAIRIKEIKQDMLSYGDSLIGKFAAIDSNYKTDAEGPAMEILKEENTSINERFENVYSSQVFMDEDEGAKFVVVLGKDQQITREVDLRYNCSIHFHDVISHDYLMTYNYLNTGNIDAKDVDKVIEDIEYVCGKLENKEEAKKALSKMIFEFNSNEEYDAKEIFRTIYSADIVAKAYKYLDNNDSYIQITFQHNVTLVE
jgi:hypothetical protein